MPPEKCLASSKLPSRALAASALSNSAFSSSLLISAASASVRATSSQCTPIAMPVLPRPFLSWRSCQCVPVLFGQGFLSAAGAGTFQALRHEVREVLGCIATQRMVLAVHRYSLCSIWPFSFVAGPGIHRACIYMITHDISHLALRFGISLPRCTRWLCNDIHLERRGSWLNRLPKPSAGRSSSHHSWPCLERWHVYPTQHFDP